MKKTTLLLLFITIISCESKEAIMEKITALKVDIVDLTNNAAVINYNSAIYRVQEEELKIESLSKQIEQATEEAQIIQLETIKEGAQFRVKVDKERVENLKPSYIDIMNLIEKKKKKILELEQKLK